MINQAKSRQIWLIYDSRYLTDEDNAIAYCVCDSYTEANDMAKEYSDNVVIVKADEINGIIQNEKIVEVTHE